MPAVFNKFNNFSCEAWPNFLCNFKSAFLLSLLFMLLSTVIWCWAFVEWIRVPVRGSLCLFWHETHTKGLCARFPTSLEEDKGRKVPEWREGVIWQKEAEQKSGQKSGEADSRERQLLESVDSDVGLTNIRGWVSIPGDFVGVSRIHARDSSQNDRKVSQISPFLHLELIQVHVCLFSFLPPSRLCMLCFVCL